MIGCTRTSLNVVASDKGLVVGRVQYLEAGDPIDCTRMGVGGKVAMCAMALSSLALCSVIVILFAV